MPPATPQPECDADRKLLADVREIGWHLIHVPEVGRTPGWAFSIGLFRSFDHPEIVIFGLPRAAMLALLDRLASNVRDGARYLPGSSSERVLEGYECSFRPVRARWLETFLGYASWFYAGDGFPCVQCLWPDRDGHLPDAPDFEPELRGTQPLLEFESARQARAEELLHSLDA